MQTMFKPVAIFLIIACLTACFDDSSSAKSNPQANQITEPSTLAVNQSAINSPKPQQTCHNDRIFKQYQEQNPNQKTQVLGCGEIIKVLKDDNDGSRHQKFLVKIDNYPQITVLIAHNIDIAPRIDTIKAHTPIRFYGEYIYNDKGGVIHWTHKDPAARHQDGWLEYQGQRYW